MTARRMEQFTRAVAATAEPDTPTVVLAIAARYGIEVLGPIPELTPTND